MGGASGRVNAALIAGPAAASLPSAPAAAKGRPMSKSLARVRAALSAAGLAADPLEMAAETRTAEQAAAAAGCALDQIVKSILFQGVDSGRLYLFLTAGGNRVDDARASRLAGEPLARADGRTVREVTGFAIGGVAPLGHLTRLPVWIDPRLMEFPQVWAAAGTPRHIFPAAPADLVRASGATPADFCAPPAECK
jgi:prolyl-tRNA editing enzyme YbaK/EbsC (Cys-tRNA(Pro) deacylase)